MAQGRHVTYSETSPWLVRGSWYAREVQRYTLDQLLFVGSSVRRDVPATAAVHAALARLAADQVPMATLAGERIEAKLTSAPGNGAPLGGLKVMTRSAWFAARPSGTEPIYKFYAESFLGDAHLGVVLTQAEEIIGGIVAAA